LRAVGFHPTIAVTPGYTIMNMQESKVLVTGATGFVGQRLAERLSEEGARIRVLARTPAKAANLAASGAEVVEGDLMKPETLGAAVVGCDIVFHCAAAVGEVGSDEVFRRTNVDGTLALAEAALAAGVALFVHVSSIAVYGLNPPDHVDERTPFDASDNIYCETKIGSEMAVRRVAEKGLRSVVIRPANVYGPGPSVWTVRPAKLARAGRMFVIAGGKGFCNPVFIENLVDAMLLAATTEAAVGREYIISDGVAIPWSEFFGYYGRMVGRDRLPSLPVPLAIAAASAMVVAGKLTGTRPPLTPQAVRFLMRRAVFDISRAREELGYSPTVGLDEGMRETEVWLRRESILPKRG
jgi:nucleoside-diphosphate-sugar epimerase